MDSLQRNSGNFQRGSKKTMFKQATLAAVLLTATMSLPALADSELVFFGSHGQRPTGGPPPGAPPSAPQAGGQPSGQGPRGPRDPVDIYAARFDDATGRLTNLGPQAKLERPTWIAANPTQSIIYSDNEIGSGPSDPGQVVAFHYDATSGSLKEINRVGAVGGGTTSVAFDPVTRTVLASNFNTGHVVAIPVKDDGSLATASSYQLDYGAGPNKRQSGPHAHAVIVAPSHDYILSPDMGADRLFVYKFDGGARILSPAATPFVQFPPGTGPRHGVFDPSGKYLYVMTELSAEIHSFAWDSGTGTATPIETVSTYPEAPKDLQTKDGAEIAVSANGKFLYTSTRSDNSLDVWSIDPADGKLTHVQQVSAQGKNPWSFSLAPSGRWILVTNEGSNQVVVFKVDVTTGKISATNETMDMPTPVSATFVDR